MALGTPKSVTLAVSTTATSTANRILAADSTVNRYVRGVYATNTTGAAITLNVGIGAAATLSATNADVAFGTPIPANASEYPVGQFAGNGRRAIGTGSLNEIMAFAGGAGLLLTVIYDEFAIT